MMNSCWFLVQEAGILETHLLFIINLDVLRFFVMNPDYLMRRTMEPQLRRTGERMNSVGCGMSDSQ